jgi:hypothetical protein
VVDSAPDEDKEMYQKVLDRHQGFKDKHEKKTNDGNAKKAKAYDELKAKTKADKEAAKSGKGKKPSGKAEAAKKEAKPKGKSKEDLYKETGLKPGSVDEFEDDDMRSQLSDDDVKSIVDAEKKDGEAEGKYADAQLTSPIDVVEQVGDEFTSNGSSDIKGIIEQALKEGVKIDEIESEFEDRFDGEWPKNEVKEIRATLKEFGAKGPAEGEDGGLPSDPNKIEELYVALKEQAKKDLDLDGDDDENEEEINEEAKYLFEEKYEIEFDDAMDDAEEAKGSTKKAEAIDILKGYSYNISKSDDEDEVEMDKDDYVKEHKKLISTLRTGSKKKQEAEADEQEDEMSKEVKKAHNILGSSRDFDYLSDISELIKSEIMDIKKGGKGLPIGTIKKRPNGMFKKTADGWKYHSSHKAHSAKEGGEEKHPVHPISTGSFLHKDSKTEILNATKEINVLKEKRNKIGSKNDAARNQIQMVIDVKQKELDSLKKTIDSVTGTKKEGGVNRDASKTNDIISYEESEKIKASDGYVNSLKVGDKVKVSVPNQFSDSHEANGGYKLVEGIVGKLFPSHEDRIRIQYPPSADSKQKGYKYDEHDFSGGAQIMESSKKKSEAHDILKGIA